MRAVLIAVAATIGGVASAQTAPTVEPPAAPPTPSVQRQIYGEQPIFDSVETISQEPRWRTDLLLGAPLGVRAQRQLGDWNLWGEVGAGLYLLWPTAFVGVRSEGRLLNRTNNVIAVRPGLSVYYLQGYKFNGSGGGSWSLWSGETRIPYGGMLALDFDLCWKYRWRDSFHTELGLKLGAGVVATKSYGLPVPLIGISFGLNY